MPTTTTTTPTATNTNPETSIMGRIFLSGSMTHGTLNGHTGGMENQIRNAPMTAKAIPVPTTRYLVSSERPPESFEL